MKQQREMSESFLLFSGEQVHESSEHIGHEDNGQDLSVILKCAIGSGPNEGGGNVTREHT